MLGTNGHCSNESTSAYASVMLCPYHVENIDRIRSVASLWVLVVQEEYSPVLCSGMDAIREHQLGKCAATGEESQFSEVANQRAAVNQRAARAMMYILMVMTCYHVFVGIDVGEGGTTVNVEFGLEDKGAVLLQMSLALALCIAIAPARTRRWSSHRRRIRR